VLIEEPAAAGASILAPRFWRAFIDINGRLALVTVSSFSDRPMAEDAMMGFLAQQMTRLRRSNGLRIIGEEDEIARQMMASLGAANEQRGFNVIRSGGSALALGHADPARAPVPRQRVASAGDGAGTGGGARAPARAPVAPRRPG
jgi:hypothetical protein